MGFNMRCLQYSRWTKWCAIPVALIFSASAFGQSAASTSASHVSASAVQSSAKAEVSVTPTSLLARYPTGSIVSVAQANRALAEVKKGRAEIEARLKSEEKACYSTFLANKCVAEAKDRHRLALAEIKPIQIQADQFKRHDAVVKRDKALAEKRVKDEGRTRPNPDLDPRAEKLQTKQQQAQQKEPSAAEKRAENEAAFQKKVQDRQAAQAKVEEKRAKTEARRKKKAASAAAAAANRKPVASLPEASASN